jgi:hypothetical protein
MAEIRESVVVRTPVPADIPSPLERWYLEVLFRAREADGVLTLHGEDGLPPFATEQLDVLRRLVSLSWQICPKLCMRFSAILDGVEFDDGPVDIDLGEGIEWTEVLRGLCIRDPARLPFVEVEIAHLSVAGRPPFGGSAVFIHPEGVDWFSTGDWLRQRIAARSLPTLRPARGRSRLG